MKKITIINSDITETIKKYFKNKDVEIVEGTEIINNSDLTITDNYFGDLPPKVINIHPSLLPAFNCKNAIEESLLAGVKVSGITIHSNDRIIAQYPVLIGLNTHVEDFIKGLIEIKKQLVPVVIESILNDKVFDYADLLNNPCHGQGGCQNCKKCH